MSMAGRWNKRRLAVTFVLFLVVVLLYQQRDQPQSLPPWHSPLLEGVLPSAWGNGRFRWSEMKLYHRIPRSSMRSVPVASEAELKALPRIQHDFAIEKETAEARQVRLERLALVKANFTHAWKGYKTHAWLADEVQPISGGPVTKFGGWAATLVDSLDTLWIMGLRSEFEAAVTAIERIDFTTTGVDEINVFETTIRYLGGFLAAYDLTEGRYPLLLQKALELGDMLYVAFDTPYHIPIARWKFAEARRGHAQKLPMVSLVSELGSLSLEFTRLSQLSGDPKYYDAVQRVMNIFDNQQDDTTIPGLWPIMVNPRKVDFTASGIYTIGGMADSLYEYLPKYRDMYVKAVEAMHKYIFFQARTKAGKPLLFPGDTKCGEPQNIEYVRIEPRVQHLGCFAGGMVALGARLFSRPDDMETARQLTDGCIWAYESLPAGIMPEVMHVLPCPTAGGSPLEACPWSDQQWHASQEDALRKATGNSDDNPRVDIQAFLEDQHLVPGVTRYDDTRYLLRPEAIESVFILYRLTGDASLMDHGWRMFEAIIRATQTDIAHSAVHDCTRPDARMTQSDSMESFWLAETLKYFYLLYSDPSLVSLDDFVLNTEAHPLRRPQPSKVGSQ